MKRIPIILMMTAVIAAGAFLACNKNKAYPTTLSPALATFTNLSSGTYYIKNDPNSQFKVPVAITANSSSSRTVTVSVTSPTGATSAQYSIPSTTVTIPAGKDIDSLTVKGVFAGFATGRIDTLVFTISGGDAPAAPYNTTYKLVLRKACDVVAANVIGTYANSTDTYGGSPSSQPNYTATVSNYALVTTTTATFTIQNLGATPDNGWGSFASTDPVITPGLSAKMDFTDPGNITLSIPLQSYFNSYGGGMSTITATGTYSACDNIFIFTCQVKYFGNGSTYTHVSYIKH